MILVTGGTGLVGAHLLYHLLLSNDNVRATHRKNSDLNSVLNVFSYYTEQSQELYDRIEWVEANITDLPALEEVFQGITHVYHSAAFISFNPKHLRNLRKTNVEGTSNVVNLCLKYGIQKLCYVSSIATLGETTNGNPITEETFWDSEADNNVYAITKYGAEMEVWRAIEEGLNAVIVNPGVILGEGYWYSGSGTIVRSAAKGTKYYTAGSTGFVDVQDVVKIMIRLMNSDIQHERFVLVAENVSYLKLFTLFADQFNLQPPKKLIKARTLRWVARIDYLGSKLFGSKRRLLKSMVKSLVSKTQYSSKKVEDTLDYSFKSLENTVERVAGNYSSKS